jgi:hypothetical protein
VDDTAAPPAGQFSIAGWYLYHALQPTGTEVGANGHQRLRAGTGSQNTGAFWSFGATGSTERAIGDVGSTTIAQNPGTGTDQNIYWGLRLTNTTGQLLDEFTISFIGEQWRNGGNAAVDTIYFDYSTNATSIQDTAATFTDVPSLDFASPVATATAASVNGNDPANRGVRTATVSGVNWAPGTDLWLRWDDLQIAGNDHGLAIDDVTFSAISTGVPEPTAMSVLFGAAALMGLRRRRTR